VSALVAVVAACTSFVAACSSSNSSGPGGTGSSGGSTPADYCSLLSNYITTCNITDACTLATQKVCSTYATAFSSSYVSAISPCVTSEACGDAGQATASACIAAKEATITPSATQTSLAQAYCAQCAAVFSDTAAACVSAFFTAPAAGSTTATPGDIGSFLIELNDTISTSINTTCIPALAADAGQVGCGETFDVCAAQIVEAAVPTPAACQSTSGASFGFNHLHAR
jgi:hypothetical protein